AMLRGSFVKAGAAVAVVLVSISASAQPAPTSASPQATMTPPRIDVEDPLLAPVPPAPKVLTGWREALTLITSRSVDYAVANQEIARGEGLTRQALGAALTQVDAKGVLQVDIFRGEVANPLTGTKDTVPHTPVATGTLTINQPLVAPRAWYAIGTAERT